MGCSFANTKWHSRCIYDLWQNSYKECTYIYIYIYINTELLDRNQGHQEETHRPTHWFRRLLLDLLSMGWRGCASAMGAIKLPPSCSSPKIMCQSIDGPWWSIVACRLYLTHWGRDQIDTISQTIFSNVFSRLKMNEFHLGFHRSLFLRFELTIFQHWFR